MNPPEKTGVQNTQTHTPPSDSSDVASRGTPRPNKRERSFTPPQSNRENDVYECLKLHSFLPATHLAFICTLLGIETYALPRSHPSLCSATIRSWKARNLPGMQPPYSPVFPQRLVFCMVNRSGDFVRSRGETRDQSSADSRGSLSPSPFSPASATPKEQCRIHRENTHKQAREGFLFMTRKETCGFLS
jgi:hypothetical protein